MENVEWNLFLRCFIYSKENPIEISLKISDKISWFKISFSGKWSLDITVLTYRQSKIRSRTLVKFSNLFDRVFAQLDIFLTAALFKFRNLSSWKIFQIQENKFLSHVYLTTFSNLFSSKAKRRTKGLHSIFSVHYFSWLRITAFLIIPLLLKHSLYINKEIAVNCYSSCSEDRRNGQRAAISKARRLLTRLRRQIVCLARVPLQEQSPSPVLSCYNCLRVLVTTLVRLLHVTRLSTSCLACLHVILSGIRNIIAMTRRVELSIICRSVCGLRDSLMSSSQLCLRVAYESYEKNICYRRVSV